MVVYHVAAPDSPVRVVLYLAAGFAAAAALAVGTLLAPHSLRWAWGFIMASQLAWASADVLWHVLSFMGYAVDVSIADAIYTAGYVSLVTGLGLMLRSGRQNRGWSDTIDVATIAVAMGLVLWPFAFEPTVDLGWSLANVIGVIYPAGDVLLLALLASLFFDGGKRTASVKLMMTAVALVFAADFLYYVPLFSASSMVDPVANAAWIAGYLVFGAAGLHSSSRAGAISASPVLDSPLRRLRFVGVALVALPSAFLGQALFGQGFSSADLAVFATANGIVAVLVVVRTALLLRDVQQARSEASSAQNRFESVFQSAGLGISITTDGLMAQTNRAFQELVGYTGEELSRMRPSMIVHADDVENVVEESSLADSARTSFERRYLRRDGSVVQTQVTLTAAHDDNLAIAVVEDITLRAKLEEQLHEAQKLEAIGRLAGGVAHDFNNLLTMVSGHAELLRTEVSGQQGQDDINVILDAVRRASDLTRQLLAFSRLQELDPVTLSAADVVRETELLLGRLIGKFVQLESSIDDNAPLVSADPVQLNQVLLNLAVNARDAMPSGGVLALRVDGWSTAEVDARGVAPGRYCRITVTDTGTGMDEATQARIFEPFFTTKGPGAGTGLGLATTYGIVRQSSGHIFVDSRLGHGTTFEILLPEAAGERSQLVPVAA
jgi:PAS domain S-box-containing protein